MPDVSCNLQKWVAWCTSLGKERVPHVESMFGSTLALSKLQLSDDGRDGAVLAGCSDGRWQWLTRHVNGGLRKLFRQEEKHRASVTNVFKPSRADTVRATAAKTRQLVKTIHKVEGTKTSLKSATHVFVKVSVGKLDMRAGDKCVLVPSIFRADFDMCGVVGSHPWCAIDHKF